jgi:6-phosphogluconolactonase
MQKFNWQESIQPFNEKFNLIIPGNTEVTTEFCVNQFIEVARTCIDTHGFFTVAVSGGTTPNAIFAKLSQQPYRDQVNWSKVRCFWSDERSVAPTDPESNFGMAMKAGLAALPIEHLYRMQGEGEVEENALEYEKKIIQFVPERKFDLVMLGMGEDGHTASLFPYTHGLHAANRLAIANYVPQKNTWRLSLTYECINSAHLIFIYAMGKGKAAMVAEVLTGPYDPDRLPVQRVGTAHNKALWILNDDAAEKFLIIVKK